MPIAPSLCVIPMPPRTTRKSIGHEPQIDPWLTPYNRRAFSVSELIGVVVTKEDAAAEMEQPKPRARHHTSVFQWREGWMARTIPRPRWREKNVLDIPFYRSGHYTQNPWGVGINNCDGDTTLNAPRLMRRVAKLARRGVHQWHHQYYEPDAASHGDPFASSGSVLSRMSRPSR